MENKSYELVTSLNMKYIAGICRKNIVDGMCEMKIWKAQDMCENSVFFVHVDFGGKRFSISNGGDYVATAKYEDYEGGNLYVYEVETGKSVFCDKTLRRIQWVMFGEDEVLIVGTENSGIFYFDFRTGKCIEQVKGKKLYYNKFGEDILLLDEKSIKYMDKLYKSSTFTYLCAIGTQSGILVSEANGDLLLYNNDGTLCWKFEVLELGHFILLFYNETNKTVLGITLNPRKKGDERMHLVILQEATGKMISVNTINTGDYVFVEEQEIIKVINGKGIIYKLNNGELESGYFR